MAIEMLVYVGTYTQPIRFGTGRILEGKGEGIYVYRMDRASGALEAVSKATGIANPSYLAFDPSRRFLYAVNELKSCEGQPGGAAPVGDCRITSERKMYVCVSGVDG